MSGRVEEGTTDGMKTDLQGEPLQYRPRRTVDHLGTVRIPTPETLTNAAFGGPDGKTIFLTDHSMLFDINVKAASR